MAMYGKTYHAALKTLGVSQAKISAFLGISSRQSRRVASCKDGSITLTVAAEKLIRTMLELTLTMDMVNGFGTKKPRPKKAGAADTAAS